MSRVYTATFKSPSHRQVNIHPAALLNSSAQYKEPPAPFEMHMSPGNESLCARGGKV